MDEQLTAKAIEYLKSAENFIITEAPDVIQQTLKYATYSNWSDIILCSFFIMIAVGVFSYCFMYPKYDKYDSLEFGFIIGRFLSAAIFFPLCIQISQNVDALMKINMAPKLFLIQYFINMGK